MPATPRGYERSAIEALGYGKTATHRRPISRNTTISAARAGRPIPIYRRGGTPLLHPQSLARTSRPASPRPPSATTPRWKGWRRAHAADRARPRLDEHFFDDKIDRHITAMRLNFYPEPDGAAARPAARRRAHRLRRLTILNGEKCSGGLQVLTRRRRMDRRRRPIPTSFVVNIGDLLMRWTNDRWVSNMHRVVNPPRRRRPVGREAVDRLLPASQLRCRHRLHRAAGTGEIPRRALRRVSQPQISRNPHCRTRSNRTAVAGLEE